MDDFFGNDLMNFATKKFNYNPPVNVKETPEKFVLEMAVPGKSKEDFKLKLNENLLTISSESDVKNEEQTEKYTRKEFFHASFARTFTLPEQVNQSAIHAEYVNGILLVTMPKKELKPLVENEIKVK